MAFGQVAGFSSFAAICGFLLTNIGLRTTAAVCALTVGTIFVLVAVVRERAGERLLPWTKGEAAPRSMLIRSTFAGIFSGLFKVLLLPMSVILMSTEWIVRMRDGVIISVAPVIATQTLGFSPEAFSYLQGILGVAMAAVGLTIGPFIDRYGAREFYMIGIGGGGLVALAFAMSEPLWGETWWVVSLFALGAFFTQVLFVSFISCAMSVCWLPVAASQFAIYMSLSNLARSIGSGLFAPFANQTDVHGQMMLIASLSFAACAVLWFFRLAPHRTRLSQLDGPAEAAAR
jgi:PAT family beta-lactamase induction signal transducer AmpG